MTAKERVSQWVQKVRDQGLSLPTQFNAWLAQLPTVQFQALVSAILACGTALVYWICVLWTIEVDPTTFGIWLTFVGAYGGITYYSSFKVKRATYKPEIQSAQNQQDATATPPAVPPSEAQ